MWVFSSTILVSKNQTLTLLIPLDEEHELSGIKLWFSKEDIHEIGFYMPLGRLYNNKHR